MVIAIFKIVIMKILKTNYDVAMSSHLEKEQIIIKVQILFKMLMVASPVCGQIAYT